MIRSIIAPQPPAADEQVSVLAADVRHYLLQTPRQLPSRALYNALGSALFDAICELPWYAITRAECRLIAGNGPSICGGAGWPPRLVELGPGNGEKLSLLLTACRGRSCEDESRGRGTGRGGTSVPPDPPPAMSPDPGVRRIDLVDISPAALGAASRLVHDVHGVEAVTHQARYEDGLRAALTDRESGERVMVLFLGSNIGNFDPPGARRFLTTVRGTLQAGDTVLIGVDLVKPEHELLLAYDDPLGVTAAFNKNLIVRLNRELGATLDVEAFDHRAVWNRDASRVEMHLVSRVPQRIEVPLAGVSFDLQRGESIWTESSYKYEVPVFEAMLSEVGLAPATCWIDTEGRFLLVLARAT